MYFKHVGDIKYILLLWFSDKTGGRTTQNNG